MTEMGLAVLQQTSKFEPSFEQGVLTGKFGQVGNALNEPSFLRLVDKVEENLSHAQDNIFHLFEGFSPEEQNIEDHGDHVEKTTFNYGTKELMKGSQDHDENIVADNGYIKLGNVSPDGYNEQKKVRDWRYAMQVMMQRDREILMQRLREQIAQLEERLESIKDTQGFLNSMTQDDLKGDTAESRQKIEETKQRWSREGLDINKIPMKDGLIDLEEAKRQMERHRQEQEHRIADKQDELKELEAKNSQTASFASKNIDVNDVLVVKTNTGAEANAKVENSIESLGDIEFETETEATPSPNNNSLRSQYSSAASQIDGVNTSVLSRSFTELAQGRQRDTSVTPTIKPEFTNSPAASTMRMA